MAKYFLLLLIITAFNPAWAQSTRDEIIKMLPPELAKLSAQDNEQKLRTSFAKQLDTKKSNSSSLYLNYFSEQNDVTLGLLKGNFHYLYLEAPKEMKDAEPYLFSKIYAQLSKKEKAAVASDLTRGGHDAGHYISIDLPAQGLRLRFNNSEKKELKSILMWPVGGKHP